MNELKQPEIKVNRLYLHVPNDSILTLTELPTTSYHGWYTKIIYECHPTR